jgi:hypothetical protein
VQKTGKQRPWESLRASLSHSFNNKKLDDSDNFLENPSTSVASLRSRSDPSRNSDRDQFGMPIGFIGIPKSRHLKKEI